MSLKIERSCDWCDGRAAVELPKTGPLDLARVGLPDGWEGKGAFPGGNVGDQDGQELCGTCAPQWEAVLQRAESARDTVYTQAMAQAKKRQGSGNIRGGKPSMSSSFAASSR